MGEARVRPGQVVRPMTDGAAPHADTSPRTARGGRRRGSPRVVILVTTVLALIAVAATVTVVIPDSSDEPLSFLRPDPTRIVFDRTGPREGLVTVRNTSADAAVVLQEPRIEGPGLVAFSFDAGTCRAALDTGRSCEMTVRFAPPRSGTFIADLTIRTDRGRAPDVELVGTAQL